MTRTAMLIILMVALPASAGVYKWVDDKGNVHYSDKPVGDAQKLRIQNSPPAEEGQDTYRKSMDDAKERFRLEEAVLDRKVLVGMSQEQVKAAWGAPSGTRTTTNAAGVTETWNYQRGRSVTAVVFREGKVASISSNESGAAGREPAPAPSSSGSGEDPYLRNACQGLRGQLDQIERELKQGYSTSTGSDLRSRRFRVEKEYGEKGCGRFY